MMVQCNLFDQPTEAEKQKAILIMMEKDNKSWLYEARKRARRFCYQNKGFPKYGIPYSITSDDVRELMGIENSGFKYSNNVMGSLFRDGRFKKTGEYYASKALGSHGSIRAIWVLKND